MSSLALVGTPVDASEPTSSVFLAEQAQSLANDPVIGREAPQKTGGYIYRDVNQPWPPENPLLPVSNIYDEINNEGREPGEQYNPTAGLPITAWTRDGQSGGGPVTGMAVPDQVPYDLQAWWETGAAGIGAMPYPSNYGMSELVSVTPEKQPILLGPAGLSGMGWPQTVTTPPWIDIGDQTPEGVIGLGAGVNVNDGSIGPGS